ncbi:hypothetical protein GCM10023325_23680 [Sphingomonas lutea]
MTALAAAAPATAQSWTSGAIGSGSAFAGSQGGPGHAIGIGSPERQHGDRRNHRRGRGFDGPVVFGGWDRDYQGDSAWRANSFNDWWHERPNRSFPRWMQNNQNCERQWWGGGQWRC